MLQDRRSDLERSTVRVEPLMIISKFRTLHRWRHDQSCDSQTRRDGCLPNAHFLALLSYMDDETDNTMVDTCFLESPKPPPSQQPPAKQDPTLEELLGQSPTDIVRTFAASINQGAMKEANKSEEFRQGICMRKCAYMQVFVDYTTKNTLQSSKDACFGSSFGRMCGRPPASRMKRT